MFALQIIIPFITVVAFAADIFDETQSLGLLT